MVGFRGAASEIVDIFLFCVPKILKKNIIILHFNKPNINQSIFDFLGNVARKALIVYAFQAVSITHTRYPVERNVTRWYMLL